MVDQIKIFPDWIKNKKATTNPTNDYKWFQYFATVAWDNKEIGDDSQRISKLSLL